MLRRVCVGLLVVAIGVCGCKKTTVVGPNQTKLTLVKPLDTTVKRGGTSKIPIVIQRENISGPVTVEFKKLPKGVTVTDNDGKLEGNERTFVLQASDSADLVSNHSAEVSLRGPGGMTATEVFRVTVTDKG